MKDDIIMGMASPMRDIFRIHALRFGSPGQKTVALVGAMRGDEVQQLYIASQVVIALRVLEQQGKIKQGCGITVIPSANPFSMNIGKRFWAMDNTDINRMFPGYHRGETTQRIAAALFDELQGYTYGMQLASFYIPGDFIPHVRMIDTGYQDVTTAALFGLPYTLLAAPRPYDTTLLNYNWQIWNTKAYSLYAGPNGPLGGDASQDMVNAIINFMGRIGALDIEAGEAMPSVLIDQRELLTVKPSAAGIFSRIVAASDRVSAGDVMALIIDPIYGDVKEEVRAPADGEVFFAHSKPLALEGTPLFKLII